MKKGDVIRQKCVNTTFYLTGISAHKVNNCICIAFDVCRLRVGMGINLT